MIWIPFISFPSLIAEARTSSSILNNTSKSEYPCLVPDLRKNAFGFSPLRIMFAVGLSCMASTMLRQVPYMTIFWRVLIINGCWIFSKAFSASIEMVHMVFIFQFVNMVYHIDLLVYVEESLHPWNKPNLIIVYELFNVLLNSLLKLCWRFLHLCLSVVLGCSILFCCCFCQILVSGLWWPRRMSLEVLFPLQFFDRVLEG